MKIKSSIIASITLLTLGFLSFSSGVFAAQQEKKFQGAAVSQGGGSQAVNVNFNQPPGGLQGKGAGPAAGGWDAVRKAGGPQQDFLKVDSFSHKVETTGGGAAGLMHKNEGHGVHVDRIEMKAMAEHKNEIKNAFGSPALLTETGFPASDGGSKELAFDVFHKGEGREGMLLPAVQKVHEGAVPTDSFHKGENQGILIGMHKGETPGDLEPPPPGGETSSAGIFKGEAVGFNPQPDPPKGNFLSRLFGGGQKQTSAEMPPIPQGAGTEN